MKMSKSVLAARGFRNHKFFAIVAVFALIAVLLTIGPVADFVVKTGGQMGIKMPSPLGLRTTASHLFLAACGLMLLLLVPLVLIPIVKFALIGAGLALLGYGAYNVYRLLKGGQAPNILPYK